MNNNNLNSMLKKIKKIAKEKQNQVASHDRRHLRIKQQKRVVVKKSDKDNKYDVL